MNSKQFDADSELTRLKIRIRRSKTKRPLSCMLFGNTEVTAELDYNNEIRWKLDGLRSSETAIRKWIVA